MRKNVVKYSPDEHLQTKNTLFLFQNVKIGKRDLILQLFAVNKCKNML